MSSETPGQRPPLVPTTETATRIGVTPKHLRHLARTGRVPHRRLGNQWLFFDAWINWLTTWTPPSEFAGQWHPRSVPDDAPAAEEALTA